MTADATKPTTVMDIAEVNFPISSHENEKNSPSSPCPTSTSAEPSTVSSVSSAAPQPQVDKQVDSLYVLRKKSTTTRKVFGVCKRKLVPDCIAVESRKERRVSEATCSSSDDEDGSVLASSSQQHTAAISPTDGEINSGQENRLDFPSDESMKTASSEEKESSLHPMLQSARDYFEDLDRTSLVIEAKGNHCKQTPGKHFKIRTRRCKLPKDKAEQEYRRYCNFCKDSNIKALPIDSFLEQRAGYFRRHEVFDGMFDE